MLQDWDIDAYIEERIGGDKITAASSSPRKAPAGEFAYASSIIPPPSMQQTTGPALGGIYAMDARYSMPTAGPALGLGMGLGLDPSGNLPPIAGATSSASTKSASGAATSRSPSKTRATGKAIRGGSGKFAYVSPRESAQRQARAGRPSNNSNARGGGRGHPGSPPP